MKKTSCVLILALILSFFNSQAKNWALVVGISNYQDAGLGWSKLHGTNDVDLLMPVLKRAGFTVIPIKDKAATHARILTELDKLKKNCKSGDKVLVHLSGHGQQMINTMGDQNEGNTEAFIPYDAAKVYCAKDKGEKHLTDDEFYLKLKAIKECIGTKGELMVTVDACHSGDMTRESIEVPDSILNDKELGKRGSKNDIFGKGKLMPANATKPKVPSPCDYELSACPPENVSRECRGENDSIYGPLSYLLYEGIKQQNGRLNFNRLYQFVIDKKNYQKRMLKAPYSRCPQRNRARKK